MGQLNLGLEEVEEMHLMSYEKYSCKNGWNTVSVLASFCSPLSLGRLKLGPLLLQPLLLSTVSVSLCAAAVDTHTRHVLAPRKLEGNIFPWFFGNLFWISSSSIFWIYLASVDIVHWKTCTWSLVVRPKPLCFVTKLGKKSQYMSSSLALLCFNHVHMEN